MSELKALTPSQRSLADLALRRLAPPLNPAPGAATYEQYVVARAVKTVPSPYGAANSPLAPRGVGVIVHEVGSASTLARLEAKGHLTSFTRIRLTVVQRFYVPTDEGLAWFRRRQAAEQRRAS